MSYTERLIIEKLYNSGHSRKEIASIIECHLDTIYREIRRGLYDHMKTDLTFSKRYSADIAQHDYDYKASIKGAPLKIGKDHALANWIEHKIADERYSPAAAFADCKGMEFDLKGNRRTTVYYCHPYTSCERGSNERQNRIIRRFFPKGESLSKVTNADAQKAADWINNLPRKKFGFRSSADLFREACLSESIALPSFVKNLS